ncbi:DMT family transporter [Halobacterium bonnevillei]|uniref:EamA family transporter n=1 Tax=Halobacterium bonnevillei TaxID=2692200 RepID=A0A6B0SD91_9EURY|nr:EamA family transporter [Halobacterium bonnevillei]MXR19358.1 EamA family transporter [Halobacterium bonnevillei]
MSYRRHGLGVSPATVMFLALAAIWGTSFPAIEIGLHSIPALSFAAMRYTAAGVIILAYASIATDRWRPRSKHEWLAASVAGVLVIAVYHGLLYLGELRVSGAVAAIVVSLTPVLTAGLATVLLDSDIDLVEGLGLFAGFAGVVIVASPGSGSTDLLGVALVFGGALAFALGAVLARPLDTDLPIETMEGWAMLIGSAVLWVGAGARGESLVGVEWTLPAIASLLYLTLVAGCIGFLLYFELLGRIGATELNLVGYLEPVVAAMMAWLLLGQVVDSQAVAGFAAIFLGFALLKRDVLSAVAIDTADAVRSH